MVFPGPSQLNPSRRRGPRQAAPCCAVPLGSSGEIGRKKKWSEMRERRGEVPAKTEVKRYIWLNGHGRATVYKAFYIYRIPVVARFLYRGDKRLSSMTDLLSRRVFPDSATGNDSSPSLSDCRSSGEIAGGMFRGEILIGQFVGVARVKDVCVIENTRGRINRLAAITNGNGGRRYILRISFVWLKSCFVIMIL